MTEWRRVNGVRVRMTGADRAARPAPPSATAVERIALVKVEAEQQRQRFITAGDGKAGEYAGLQRELDRYERDPAPTDADYPFLLAGAEGEGRTLADEAVAVRTAVAFCQQVNAKIRQLETGYCKALAAAPDATALAAISIDWSAVDARAAELRGAE